GEIYFNNRVSYYSAQPVSEKCGAGNVGTGQRAASPQDRICPDGSVLKRNTLRKDNAYFSWDVRVSRPIDAGRQQVELMVEVFNLTNTDNFKDPAYGGLLSTSTAPSARGWATRARCRRECGGCSNGRLGRLGRLARTEEVGPGASADLPNLLQRPQPPRPS